VFNKILETPSPSRKCNKKSILPHLLNQITLKGKTMENQIKLEKAVREWRKTLLSVSDKNLNISKVFDAPLSNDVSDTGNSCLRYTEKNNYKIDIFIYPEGSFMIKGVVHDENLILDWGHNSTLGYPDASMLSKGVTKFLQNKLDNKPKHKLKPKI